MVGVVGSSPIAPTKFLLKETSFQAFQKLGIDFKKSVQHQTANEAVFCFVRWFFGMPIVTSPVKRPAPLSTHWARVCRSPGVPALGQAVRVFALYERDQGFTHAATQIKRKA